MPLEIEADLSLFQKHSKYLFPRFYFVSSILKKLKF